jgi:DNA helicase HerA-like ATPase
MQNDHVEPYPGPVLPMPEDGRSSAHSFLEVLATPEEALRSLNADIEAADDLLPPDPTREGAVGSTMFDSPASEDNSVTVLLADEHIADVPSQSLVRIKSKDGKRYLGTVVAGPFAEPDGLRADSNILVTTVTRGGIFVPPYHGRVQVEIMGEEQDGVPGSLVPPRYRPVPNSPVHVIGPAETADLLGVSGEIQLGQVIGMPEVVVGVPATRKDVLPRHTAILGTTGGGKSTTVARLVQQARAAGCAVILLDVEGEYTFLHEPTEDTRMRAALDRRGLAAEGIPNTTLYHLMGRETANPDHPARQAFSLQFARLSPYAVMEILELTDAQRARFLQAYDVSKALLRHLDIFPKRGIASQQQLAVEIDELTRGWPRLTLSIFLDVVKAGLHVAQKLKEEDLEAYDPRVAAAKSWLLQRFTGSERAENATSWRALLARLWTLHRLRVFDLETPDEDDGKAFRYDHFREPGSVSILDLSDTSSPALSNLVIADLLMGVMEAQDAAYDQYERAKREGREARPPTRVLVVIEEAHEFLSAERTESMGHLLEQVSRIARRGRKRWLGLVFVTQLPQYLPRQLFGLVNGYILHKLGDPRLIDTLQRTVSGIDDSLWKRLPGLAPGQAIVAFPHLARPLLVAMDPAPSKLRLVD